MADNRTTELGSTARTNELLAESETQTGIDAPRFKDPVSQGTISAPDVESASKINIPDRPTEDVANSVISSTVIQPEEDPNIARQRQEDSQQATSGAEDLRKTISDRQSILEELGLGDIKDSFEDLLQKGAFTQEAENKAGIGDKTTALNEINSQLREKDLQFRRNIERIQDEPGLTSAQKNSKINDVNRKQARELADLSVISATRRDDLTTAQALVDRKVELTFEPIQQKLEFQQIMYNENKDLFNTAEQRQFESKLRTEQVQIDKDKFKFQQIENSKLELMRNAKVNGASNSVLTGIQNAETLEQAFAAAGSYGTSLDDKVKKMKLDELMSTSTTGSLSEKDKKAILKDKTGQQTTALIAADRVIKQYVDMIEADFSPSPSGRKKLNAFLLNVIAPTLAVASGQGAITDGEREGIIEDLGTSFFGRESTAANSAKAVRDGFQIKVDTNLSALDSAYPGASEEFGIFKEFNEERLSESLGSIEERALSITESQVAEVAALADSLGLSVDEVLADNDIYTTLIQNR